VTRKITLYLVLLCIISLVQELGVSRITIFRVSPDIVTIFLAFIAVTTSQKTSTSFGFAAGVLTGLLTGNIGLNMLARTAGSFIAGYFHTPITSHATAKQKTRRFYGAVIAAGICVNAVLANGSNPLGLSLAYRVVFFGLLESLFNLILAVILNRLFLSKSFAD
jgi:rod shape-determining protein MreD